MASGDYTVYSGGSSLEETSVRVPRRGGKSVSTGCYALIIEMEYTYDEDSGDEAGIAIAIQEEDSDRVYVSGGPDMTIYMAFNPSGDYKSKIDFDPSSAAWSTPKQRPGLRGRGSFADAETEFGAEPLAFDDSDDGSINKQNGTYVFYCKLPFCEQRSGSKKPGRPTNGDKNKPNPSSGDKETGDGETSESGAGGPKPDEIASGGISTTGDGANPSVGNNTDATTGNDGSNPVSGDESSMAELDDDDSMPVSPGGYKNVSIAYHESNFFKKNDLQELGLPNATSISLTYALTAADEFEVFVLGESVDEGSLQTVLVGKTVLPCVPLVIVTTYNLMESSLSMPAIAVSFRTEVDGKIMTFNSGNMTVWAAVNPAGGFLDPKSGYDFSSFRPAVPMPSPSNHAGFGLIKSMYNATAVGPAPFTNINDAEPVSGDDSTEVTVVYVLGPPTCKREMLFDENGKPSYNDLKPDKYKSLTNATTGNDSGKNVSIQSYKGPLFNEEQKKDFEGDLEGIPTLDIGYAIVGTNDFDLFVLGKHIRAGGSPWKVSEGFVDLPCVPVIVEMKGNASALSVAIVVDPMGSRTVFTSGDNPSVDLSIVVAHNPRPGYLDMLPEYDFTSFKQALPQPSLNKVGGFSVLSDLYGAVPVAAVEVAPEAIPDEDQYYEDMEKEAETPSTKHVFMIRPPICKKMYEVKLDDEDDMDDDMDDEINEDQAPSDSSPTQLGNDKTLPVSPAGYKNITILYNNDKPYEPKNFDSSDLEEYGLNASDVPTVPLRYALTAADQFEVQMLGKKGESGTAKNVVIGKGEMPCAPIIVITKYDSMHSNVSAPAMAVSFSSEENGAVKRYSSGNITVWSAVNPPSGYLKPKPGYNLSVFDRAVPIPQVSNQAGFGLMKAMYNASAVGPRQYVDSSGGEEMRSGQEYGNSMEDYKAEKVTIVYILAPPTCKYPKFFTADGEPSHVDANAKDERPLDFDGEDDNNPTGDSEAGSDESSVTTKRISTFSDDQDDSAKEADIASSRDGVGNRESNGSTGQTNWEQML